PAARSAQSTTMRRPSSRFGRVAINRWTYQSAPPSRSATTRPIDAPAGPGPVAVASRSSMASSVALASLVPPGPKNLSPLSGIGLWLAEILTPNAGAGGQQTGGNRRLQEVPGRARVPAEHDQWPLRAGRRHENLDRRSREPHGQLGGQVDAGDPAYPIRPEQTAHVLPLRVLRCF